jgi:hypothetical protein
MTFVKSNVTLNGRAFLIAWSILLILFFVIIGTFSLTKIDNLKKTSAARHADRMSASRIEAGRTAPELTLPAGSNPEKVQVGVYLDHLASISVADNTWSPEFYLWFKWSNDAINPGDTFDIIEGEIVSKQKQSEFHRHGEHYEKYLIKAQITKYFDSLRFPLDDHVLTISIEDGKFPWKDLEYVSDIGHSNISSRVKIPGYIVTKHSLIMKPHTYKSNFGDPRLEKNNHATFSQHLYGVSIARDGLGIYFKVFIGLFAAVAISLLAFFIKPTDVDPRFGLGVGGFFGAVANSLLSVSFVADNGSLSLLDMVNMIGLISIFLTLVESTISLYLFDIRGEVALSRLFDRVSFTIIFIGFTLINIFIPIIGSAN